jgi:uncharacterized protein
VRIAGERATKQMALFQQPVETMVVGVAKLSLFLPACHSLKEKRQVLRKVKDRTLNRFKLYLAEVGAQDLWQRAELGLALAGNDRRVLQSLIDQVFDFVNSFGELQILDQWSELVNY